VDVAIDGAAAQQDDDGEGNDRDRLAVIHIGEAPVLLDPDEARLDGAWLGRRVRPGLGSGGLGLPHGIPGGGTRFLVACSNA
jgi:hypothetical protein